MLRIVLILETVNTESILQILFPIMAHFKRQYQK